MILLTFFLMVTIARAESPTCDHPQPFVSDGCTSPFQRDDLTDASFVRCCYMHDLAYYRGGSEWRSLTQDVQPVGAPRPTDRERADEAFEDCLKGAILRAESSLSPALKHAHARVKSKTMATAVRVAGGTNASICSMIKDGWHWGYAWRDRDDCVCRHQPSAAAIDEALKSVPGPQSTNVEIARWILAHFPATIDLPNLESTLRAELARMLAVAEPAKKAPVKKPGAGAP